jgi:hypothetical protein
MNDALQQQIIQRLEKLENDIQEIKTLLQDGTIPEPTSIDKEPVEAVKEEPEELLAHLFTIVQQDLEEEDWSKTISPLLHSSISEHNVALHSFLRYSFKTFKARWKDYLQEDLAPNSFKITRRQQNNRGELSELRLYLHVSHRSSTPITFKKDPNHNLAWKILSLSL